MEDYIEELKEFDQCRGVYNEDYVQPKTKNYAVALTAYVEATDGGDAIRILNGALHNNALATIDYDIENIEEEIR